MNKAKTRRLTWTLGGLLTAQLMLVAVLQWSQLQGGESEQAMPLLASASQAVNRIEISDGDKKVVLSKVNDQWQLPDFYQLPADGFKVSELIAQLKRNKTRWPVATSEGAKERFEVADDKYKRRLKLWSGDKLISDVFVGTSPGFRQSHVRRAEEKEIYALEINSYAIAVNSNDWLDKNLLQVKSFDAIESENLSLKKEEGKWQLVSAPEVENLPSPVKDDELNRLQNKLSSLRVLDVADRSLEQVDYTFSVQAGDKSYRFELAKLDDSYWLRRDDFAQLFKISQLDYDYFKTLDGKKLAATETNKESATAVAEQSAGETEKATEPTGTGDKANKNVGS